MPGPQPDPHAAPDRAIAPLALVGPTASGKTEVALRLAPQLGAEIISVDSMLVYRGMDVGTAKPTPAERERVPHHLVDVAEPSAPFSVAQYQALGRSAMALIARRGSLSLLSGGSGLYFRALVDEMAFPGTDPAVRSELEREAVALGSHALHRRLVAVDPVAASKIEIENVRRTIRALEVAAITGRTFSSFADAWERYPPGNVRAAGIEIDREILASRIRARTEKMLAEGWLEEVEALLDRGFGDWLTATQAIGYAELAGHLQGRSSLEEAMDVTIKRTKKLARRQMAWFRRDPRIRWFTAGVDGGVEVADAVGDHLLGVAD
jgi:tRNA dimethylallyltransferase